MVRRKETAKVFPVIEVKIDRVRVHLDPDISVYHVVVSGDSGRWSHTTSEEGLQEFLRGLRAGVSIMGGRLEEQEVPLFATHVAIPHKK